MSYAHGQRPSASNAETERLQKALGQALDRITDLEKRLDAASAAIEALKAEREASAALVAQAQAERESLERQVKYAGDVIKGQQQLDEARLKIIAAQEKLIDRYEVRVVKLEDKLDGANKRTLGAGALGFVFGVLTKVFGGF